VDPSPLPCFLEVLILRDFKSLCPEVLILRGFKSLFLEVLILVGLKSFGMRVIQKIAKFLEVLILEELGWAMCRNGWNWSDFGNVSAGGVGRVGKATDRFGGEGICSRFTSVV